MLILHPCPTCKAPTNEICRTPSGRARREVHDNRPFSITRNDATNGKFLSLSAMLIEALPQLGAKS